MAVLSVDQYESTKTDPSYRLLYFFLVHRTGEVPLEERRAALHDTGFLEARAEAKREIFLKRLENLLDKYETRVRRSEDTEN